MFIGNEKVEELYFKNKIQQKPFMDCLKAICIIKF